MGWVERNGFDVGAAEEGLASDRREKGLDSFIKPGVVEGGIRYTCREVVCDADLVVVIVNIDKKYRVDKTGHCGGNVAGGIGFTGHVVSGDEDLSGDVAAEVGFKARASESAEILESRAAGIGSVGECVEEREHERSDEGIAESIEEVVARVSIHELVGGEGRVRSAIHIIDQGEGIELEQTVGYERGRRQEGTFLVEGLVQFHHIVDDVLDGVAGVGKRIDGVID
jgi:predicted small metal-binding protein